MLIPLVLVASGGALGAVARYLILNGLTGFSMQGILSINLIGAFCVGISAAFFPQSEGWRLFWGVGVLGGFTTFSAMVGFLFENGNLQNYGLYFLQSLFHTIGGLVMAYLGWKLAHLVGVFVHKA